MARLLEGARLLDQTLAIEEFSDQALLKDYLRGYLGTDENGEAALQNTTNEVWTFLEDMRSVSIERTRHLQQSDSASDASSQDTEWKLKDDTGVYRVLYKKGPEGTPLHALCLEGVIEGPALMGLCVAWEAPHFKDWWPQFSVPPFKIVESKWLKRVKPGIDVPYIRFKVPWPFAPREIAIVSFELEHAESGCVIAMMKSVPEDPRLIDGSEGYLPSDLPPPNPNWVRMGVSGGYMLQQITADRCYFRTISHIDMKLDLVPAWVINFVSRQLAGNGFKLFQEAVTEGVQNKKGLGAIHQRLAAEGPLYARVRAALQAHSDLEEARKLIAAGKRVEAEAMEAGLSRRIGERVQQEVEATLANGDAPAGAVASGQAGVMVGEQGEEGEAYAGLAERDPEVYSALRSIDRAIALLKARKLTRSLSRSRDRSLERLREEAASEASGSPPPGTSSGAGSGASGGSTASQAPAGSVQATVGETARGPSEGNQEAPAGDDPLVAVRSSRTPRPVVDYAGVNPLSSGAAERLEGLRAMSGRREKPIFSVTSSWVSRTVGATEEDGDAPKGGLGLATISDRPGHEGSRRGSSSSRQDGRQASADLQIVESPKPRKSFRKWLKGKGGGRGKKKGGS